MANLNNLSILKGRLTNNVVTFANTDGSTKAKFTLAVEDNFKDKQGNKKSQMIPVEAYVKGDFAQSPFARIHKGDKVAVECSLRDNNYTDTKTGEKHYGIVVFVENIQFEESKSVTEARAAANAAVPTAPVAAPVAAPVVA